MESTKGSGAGDKPAAAEGNPNPNPDSVPTAAAAATVTTGDDGVAAVAAAANPSRTPFTDLSQVDADLALARVLQEQERAYMMLRANGGVGEGSDYGSSEEGSYEYEDEEEEVEVDGENNIAEGSAGREGGATEGSDYGEDAFDANEDGNEDMDEEEDDDAEPEIDPADYEDDEAYARALQENEEREMAARFMAFAGFGDWREVDHDEHGSDPQDAWEEVDPDEYSYEELVALGEVVGTESRGLSADVISSLSSIIYKSKSNQDGNTDQCVICRLDYEEDETLVVLPCKHAYHKECIQKWLQINKVCPMCSAEVSTSTNSK